MHSFKVVSLFVFACTFVRSEAFNNIRSAKYEGNFQPTNKKHHGLDEDGWGLQEDTTTTTPSPSTANDVAQTETSNQDDVEAVRPIDDPNDIVIEENEQHNEQDGENHPENGNNQQDGAGNQQENDSDQSIEADPKNDNDNDVELAAKGQAKHGGFAKTRPIPIGRAQKHKKATSHSVKSKSGHSKQGRLHNKHASRTHKKKSHEPKKAGAKKLHEAKNHKN